MGERVGLVGYGVRSFGGSGRCSSERFASRGPTFFATRKAWRTWRKFLGQNRFWFSLPVFSVTYSKISCRLSGLSWRVIQLIRQLVIQLEISERQQNGNMRMWIHN